MSECGFQCSKKYFCRHKQASCRSAPHGVYVTCLFLANANETVDSKLMP